MVPAVPPWLRSDVVMDGFVESSAETVHVDGIAEDKPAAVY
jgi:hypothetical protein